MALCRRVAIVTLAACYLVVSLKRGSMKNLAPAGLNAVMVKTSSSAATPMKLITVSSVITGALQTMESDTDTIAGTRTSIME